MPSGYTSDIYEGKDISGKDFILKCARAFGATIMMRDEPLDKEIPVFEPSTYYIEVLEKAKNELEKYKKMSTEEAEKLTNENYIQEVDRVNKVIEEKNKIRTRYEKVLAEVKAWQPPTSDHINLKDYAIKQLEDGIDFDCSTSYLKYPVKKSWAEWLKSKIEKCEKDIVYYTKEYEAEVERVTERNKWINELKESLQ